jgi:hypothetical protein
MVADDQGRQHQGRIERAVEPPDKAKQEGVDVAIGVVEMSFWKKAVTIAIGLVAGIGCLATATRADNYPSRTVAMIVPFPPGGPSDVVARIIADGMSRVLNQTIIIENVGGAGGTLLAAGMGSHVAAPALTPNLRYDSTKDFEPVGLISNAPVAVVARKDFPAKDIKEFIAYVKAQGDSVKQAHGGIGSASHMACLLFTSQFGLKPKGTSNNCHQSSGAPNLPTNDSALFSFRFRAVHPKDVRDCQLRQLFEVPPS